MKSVRQIAELLEVSERVVYNRFHKRGIKPICTKKGRSFYSDVQILALTPTDLYYPIKTHEVYYIYESKMNLL